MKNIILQFIGLLILKNESLEDRAKIVEYIRNNFDDKVYKDFEQLCGVKCIFKKDK